MGNGLDDTLHWKSLVPTAPAQAQALILWTVPLASVYAVLGALRGVYTEHAPQGPVGSVTQGAAFATDKLQVRTAPAVHTVLLRAVRFLWMIRQ